MLRWHYGRRRWVAGTLLERMRANARRVVFSNLQTHSVVPFLLAARRLGLPQVGYVASWDHTVGKGVISPHVDRYVVQNDVMRDDLVRYHDIPRERITVTGWPQTDVYHRRRPREDYEALLRALRARSGATARAGDGEHADECAVREPLRRARRPLVGRERRS